MDSSPAVRHWQPRCLIHFAIALMVAGVLACRCDADGPYRIWVDADGRYSVEAAVIGCDRDRVVLLRADGGQATIAIEKLSDRDQQYLDELRAQTGRGRSYSNPLRLKPPQPPVIKPLPILDLPATPDVAEERSTLKLSTPAVISLPSTLPVRLPADATPLVVDLPETRIRTFKVDNYDLCSRPLLVTPATADGGRKTSVVMSVSRGLWIPGEQPRHRLIQFDADARKVFIVREHDQTITLLDHHPSSGRSLLLVGHNSLGEGGELRIGTGWDRHTVKLSHARKLTAAKKTPGERVPHVRWARWVDEEHFIAVIDQTLGLWNLVSGDQVYRLDGIHRRARPAISPGRRYVAVPYQGAVQLFDTRTGKPLGRIGVENQVPGVSFSPQGNTLAIATSQRLRNWDLPTATLSCDIETRRGLGLDPPLWIDSDLILSSSGVLLSVFRGLPIWRYDLSASTTVSLGNRVVMFRKKPVSELSIVSLPHDGAIDAMRWIDTRHAGIDRESWRILGRSAWDVGGWTDRDVRVSLLPTPLR